MEYLKIGNWNQKEENIRYREVQFYDWDGELCDEFEFNIFKRPYFFGLIGKNVGYGVLPQIVSQWG